MNTQEIFDIPGTAVQAAITEVEDTTGVFDHESRINFRAVPGHPGRLYCPWGTDDLQPYRVAALIRGDEVCSQNIHFLAKTCYGMGVRFVSSDDTPHNHTLAAEDWTLRNSLPSYWMNQCTDMKTYMWSVAVLLLNREGTRINRIVHKEACHCRIEKADRHGHSAHIYYADWENRPAAAERIPLLDERDPLGDLLQRMGREPSRDGRTRKESGRKFAIIMRYPIIGSRYYPVPYYASVFRGGSYDEKRLISAAKRAKLKNHTSVKYQVEIERGYWERILDAAGITDPVEAKKYIKARKEEIRDFVCGIENQGKVWITGFYVNPDGHEVRDIRVICLEGQKEGGDWGDDLNISANTMCYGFGLHPNLVGAVPGKSQSNNSGSDKRELFTMQQSLEKSYHDLMLIPLNVVCRFNGWTGITAAVPLVLLTTLDKHTDAQTATL